MIHITKSKALETRTKISGENYDNTCYEVGTICNTPFDTGLELNDEAPLELETVRILRVERGVLNPSKLAGDVSRFNRRFTAYNKSNQ